MICKNCSWRWKIESDDKNPQLCHKCGFDSETNKFDMKALETWKSENLPFIEEISNYSIIRTFNEDVDTDELVWHRDYEDRVVIVLSETDWKFQFDNQLPITLKEGSEIMIPKSSYHRVIKGNGSLVVEVLKTDFGNSDTYNVIVEGEKKKKKKDACYYKVKSRYDVWPSAYASGALVQCRKVGAKNWGKTDETVGLVEDKETLQNAALDKIKSVGGFDNLSDIDKLALLGGTNDIRLKSLNLENIFKENGGSFGKFNIKVRIKENGTQPIKHKFSQEFADKEGYLSPTINHSENGNSYVTVRFNEFSSNDKSFGGGTYVERPIFLKNMYPIDYDTILSSFSDYENKVNFQRSEFNADNPLEEKTDFSKENDKGLHGWFSRKGGGGSKGWVDCNTCKKDPDTGTNKCKPCGRKEGESRNKYPACRPTPSACKTKGKGESWGKKSESVAINEQPTNNTFYHGTNHEISRFVDDFVGGKEAHDQNGPGIYFTSSKANAMTYGQHLYTVELDLKKTVSTQEGKNISYKEAEFLIKKASDWKGTAQNWHENAIIGAKLAIKDFIEYNDSPFEQFLQIWIDFYRDNSVDFVRNMVRLGYDGVIIPGLNSMITNESDITHVVVYNTNAIKHVETEHIQNENTIKENSVLASMGDMAQTYKNQIDDEYHGLGSKITDSGGEFIVANAVIKSPEHGKPNECEQNVFNFIKKMESSDGSLPKIMDGEPFYHPVVGYAFVEDTFFPVEHWWVYDSDRKKHIDITPISNVKAYGGFVLLNGTKEILKNEKWFDVSFLKFGFVNKLIKGGAVTENQRSEPLKNKKYPKSVAYLKSLLNLTANRLAITRLNGWIARAKGSEMVNLSDRENTLLGLIKSGGITPNDFGSKN